MKYFSFLLVLLMFSCNDTVPKEHAHKSGTTHEHEIETVENTPEKTSGLTLNNGEKWPADDATRTAFANMENTVKSFSEKKQNPDLNDYNWLGETLQKDLNTLFETCSMEGEAHEQLHSLLELVIADVKSLKNTDVNEASEGYKNIPQHVQMFHEYFK